jgi:hypothetical protein
VKADVDPRNANRVPSGDHEGSLINAVGTVPLSITAVWDEPFAFIVYRAASPSRVVVNTIFEPSGEESGAQLAFAADVSWVIDPPDAGTVQISLSEFSGRVLANAIVEPSGDHTGPPSVMLAMSDVSCVASVPSASITQIDLHVCAHVPAWTYAIRVPSGDHEGSPSNTVFEVSCCRPVPTEEIE